MDNSGLHGGSAPEGRWVGLVSVEPRPKEGECKLLRFPTAVGVMQDVSLASRIY